ncbi:MAG: 16S rRNA (uracil(1498)-N(3))-methyltransferase [Fimbriimonadales bacterium]|nr:16S rRNA (uracil(1498)-N(3))-methyltransferase [Fimbriimonadales bacterium]
MGRRRVPQALTPRALPRFFAPRSALEAGVLPDEAAHQAQHVLRLSAGDWVCLLDGAGAVYLAQLGEHARLTQLQPSALDTEPPFRATVLQSLVRPEKAETAIRLCVQGGASAIHFAPSERSVIKWEPSKQAKHAARWQKIAQEEAELACRAHLPEVRLLEVWRDAFAALPRPVFVLDEWEGATLLKQRVRRMPIPPSLSVVVGAEGGFSPAEREWMAAQPDVYAVSLGKRVLRTESAAFYALAQLSALWE